MNCALTPLVVVVKAPTAVVPGQASLYVIVLPVLLHLCLAVDHQRGHSQLLDESMSHQRAHYTVCNLRCYARLVLATMPSPSIQVHAEATILLQAQARARCAVAQLRYAVLV